ncbi:31553_t:CDS:1, partial [Racocetra persica]
TLFTVNVISFQKRDTPIVFSSCNSGYLFTVDMDPNPIIPGQTTTFNILAALTSDARGRGTIEIDFYDLNDAKLLNNLISFPIFMSANDTLPATIPLFHVPDADSIGIYIYVTHDDGNNLQIACAEGQ